MYRSAAPPPGLPSADDAGPALPSLKDLLGEGFHLLTLLRAGGSAMDPAGFPKRVDAYLDQFEHQATRNRKPPDLAADAKYAFCALMDEVVLGSDGSLREVWARAPLQLRHFGEHLAGEGFFQRLERLRQDPAGRAEGLEVFQTCLLLGFQGKYLLEGEEELQYLVLRLGQEIGQAKGDRTTFAPHGSPSFPAGRAGREPALWAFCTVLALVAGSIFLLFNLLLRAQSHGLSSLHPAAAWRP
jgi:type VI secretion system protein ImpK